MIYRLERAIRGVRRWLSRSEWAIWLLGLSRSQDTATSPGLVMVQIDGLSMKQFNSALAAGRMPFLRSLIQQDGYRTEVLYSGMPSSTPAVQAELMYGVRCAVPAFSFLDRRSATLVRMWDPGVVGRIEHQLAKAGRPLLAEGAAYCDIFTGGAREAHFCPSQMTWEHLVRRTNPLALALLVLSNFYSLVRAGVLAVMEFGLALLDGVTGVIAGHDLAKELRFVPARVIICVLLRELVTIGAKIDVARGLPIVHLNYLGYDEQAHRRGPDSAFAHWTLKGIDDSIARVARAAKRSARREYDVWIYSDHGQESCLPYEAVSGRSLEDAVVRALARTLRLSGGIAAMVGSEQSHRAEGMRGWRSYRKDRVQRNDIGRIGVSIAAMGPIGHVYLHGIDNPEWLRTLARDLVDMESIPAVMAPGSDGQVRAWTGAGELTLPADAERLLGVDHPFLEDAARDLIALCRHPDSGDLILSGWRIQDRPISFPRENGAHGGPGSEETHAFALLPGDVRLQTANRVARPIDLRHAAFVHFDRLPGAAAPHARPERDARPRVMT